MSQLIPETMTVTQVIQLLIAPAVMINACGLLLLTEVTQNHYLANSRDS